jgi:hypothetical protein
MTYLAGSHVLRSWPGIQLKQYFNIKGIFLCDEAIVSLRNPPFEVMR